MMKPLDPFKIDLEKVTLIEASAGTGKTYTITTLYCRLLAIGYTVESILVVTFTEAAAAELKLRVRTRLFNTLSHLLEPSIKEDDDLVGFFRQQKDMPLICKRLQLALACFDQAAIMTIHSFCLKILKENAFESHSLFDIELVPDRSLFLKQVSFDFFMGHVNTLDPLFLSFLSARNITPESFAVSFGPHVSRANLVLQPCKASFKSLFDEYRHTLNKIHDILLTRSAEIIELIKNHKGIDKRSYNKKNVPAWLDASCLKLAQAGGDTFFKMMEKGDHLYKFTRTRLALKTKTGQIAPDHEFFDLCEQLLTFFNVFENNLIHLKIEFFSFFNTELDKMKKAQGICFFDDLVNDLAHALEKKEGIHLQKAVRQAYSACLIDEFQDTDPRQYDIFSKLFSSDGTPFFMIGDPKQAIYAFRGGDIFAYLKASRECCQRFTLEKNYRSASLLVKGINQIFSNRENPFLYEPIEFSKVTTPVAAQDTLIEKDVFIAPVQFRFVERSSHPLDGQGFISKDTAAGMIPKIVADDILNLLHSDKRLKNKKLKDPETITPENIAVLVRTNLQAEQVQKALSNLNIPSYLSKTGSVFDSQQAIDLHDILWAVNTPDHKGYLKAALCTTVFNFSSDNIIELDINEPLFFKWQEKFRTYKDLWESKGFVSMIMALLHSDAAFLSAKPRLGKRGLTNFYHLIELISKACLKQQLSPYYLMKWYTRQLNKDLRDDFSDELRLESDKKAIAIVTIHKSKGLEYPIVYLPYLWEGQRKTAHGDILFHDPEKNHRLTLDLGSQEMTRSQVYFETEQKAEQRRLLYVALTRASAMCNIIWGGFKTIETSALGTLLHQNDCKDDSVMIKELDQMKSLADNSIRVARLSDKSSGLFIDSADSAMPVLAAKQTTREIKASWKMSSFSAITHTPYLNTSQGREKPDQIAAGRLITLDHFPKGSDSGDFFHSVFETLDFTKGQKDILEQVKSTYELFGFNAPDMIEMASTSVKEVLETRLVPETGTKSKPRGFCLKDIQTEQRFNEMEFLFPVKSFQMSIVEKAFELSGPEFKTSGYIKSLSQLSPQTFKGFMKGFIDLIIHHEGKWYIVDYKSNYLGHTYEAYSQDAMFEAMSGHHYFLQYHLYLVTLHRYLSLRLNDYDYDTHFGGIFYLFIRGMHPDFASKYGVFYHRPTKDAVLCLSDTL